MRGVWGDAGAWGMQDHADTLLRLPREVGKLQLTGCARRLLGWMLLLHRASGRRGTLAEGSGMNPLLAQPRDNPQSLSIRLSGHEELSPG